MSELIDKTIERTMFFHGEESKPENCPQCNQQLVQENGPYQVAIVNDLRIAEEFVLSGEFGYLCPGCATAVIHIPDLGEMLSNETGEDEVAFTVLGLINLDAIPSNQRHIPIDDLDPYPLVLFPPHIPERKKRPRKPKPKRRK